MALLRKLFYRKPPDGLLEICERVFVFDRCFTIDALEERDYKSYVGRIVSQLKEHYPDASILAFNFREGETQSQISSALSEYDTTIMEYPRQYEGCPLLPMEVIHHFLRSSESWLSLGLQNVLFMHCERGSWPILAFMLAALLIYRKHYSGELRTLDMVYKQAPREVLELFSPLNPIPSQLRYMQYVSRRNVATEWPPLDRALTLDCVIIRTIPNIDGEGGSRPIFRIYGQDPGHDSNRAPNFLFSTPKKSKAVRHYKQTECQLVKIDISCHIQGDIVMECIHLHDDTEREQMIFRVMFNTAFIRSNILILNRDEIDILWNAKDLFPKDFRAEVLFSEVDTAALVAPMDYFHFEEKDGLPVEAFGKVQEIFSGIDWLVPKGDSAVEVVQQPHVEKSPNKQSPTATDGVGRKQSDPNHTPRGIGAIISPEQTLITTGDHILPSSTLSPHKHSDGKALYSPPKKGSNLGSVQSDVAKDVSPQSRVSHLPPPHEENPNASTSPLKDESSRSHNKLIRDESAKSGAHHLTASLNKDAVGTTGAATPTDVTLDTAPNTPPHPPNLHMSPIKENSVSTNGPTLHAPCPSPPLPRKNSSVGEEDTLPQSVPHPPPISPLKEHYTSKAAPPPPSTPPLTDNSVAKHALFPPPPPPKPLKESSSGERHPLPSTSAYHGQIAPPPLPPPPPDPHLRDTSAIRPPHPPPPPPTPGPMPTLKPPPPPSPPSTGSNISTSASIPSAPPPPFPSTKQPGNLSGSPCPPPPFPPPGAKGKSTLSRTTIAKNNQTKKLKPLHWLKISRAVQGSLWAEAQKSGEAAKAPEIDMSELESLFSAAAPNKDQGGKPGARASTAQKPEKVQLIDHRRAYNCEIMLSKVKIPLPDMLNSILALEDSAIDGDQVDNLIKFCPTKEEMEMLKGYNGEKDKLGKCEQFFSELMQVPRIEYKLRVFSFKIQFHSQVTDLRKSLNVVNSAADQIKGSAKLKRIMQTILSLGNALNQGTARGSAVGFRLDSLLKLTETRARNNRMTLMHYLCKVLNDKLPELLDFWQDLSSLEPASRVQLKFLAEEMQAINKGLEKVVQELSTSENDGPVSDKFRKALKEFLCFAEGEVRSLASLYSGVGRNVDSLILYFGEDPARCPYEQVVSTLANFVRMFKQAHEENLKQQELDKKKAEKEEKEKERESEKKKAEKEKEQTLDKKKAENEKVSSEKPKINTSDTAQLLQPPAGSVK